MPPQLLEPMPAPASSAPPSPSSPSSPSSSSSSIGYPPASEWTAACPNCARPLNCCGACPGDYVLDDGSRCCSSNCRWTMVLGGARRRGIRSQQRGKPNRRVRTRAVFDSSDLADQQGDDLATPELHPLGKDDLFFEFAEL